MNQQRYTHQVIAGAAEIRAAVRDAQSRGRRVGLVPTMGALHDGHLSLVRASRDACDVTVATIFVNPTQFGPSEDLESYPRPLASDLEMLSGEGVAFTFVPTSEAMYPPDHTTFVGPPAVARPLEGECRPGHFQGVATIVLKLFNIIPADVAFFGRKDYQQSLVIRQMVQDLNVPIEIRVCPTVRESDGLAMSSRNAYLSAGERQQALALSRALFAAQRLYTEGVRDASSVTSQMRNILDEVGVTRVDYIALADPDTLQPRQTLDEPTVALIAAFVGQTRLIDNVMIG